VLWTPRDFIFSPGVYRNLTPIYLSEGDCEAPTRLQLLRA